MLVRQRFNRKHIQSRPAKPSRIEGGQKIVIIHLRTAPAIDDEGSRRQPAEKIRIHDAGCLRGQRQYRHNNVEIVGEIGKLVHTDKDVHAVDLFRRSGKAADVEPQRREPPRDDRADGPDTEDADTCAGGRPLRQ